MAVADKGHVLEVRLRLIAFAKRLEGLLIAEWDVGGRRAYGPRFQISNFKFQILAQRGCLLGTQRYHRIDFRGAAGGEPTGKRGGERQQCGHGRERQRVLRVRLVELSLDEPRAR